jgi:hypothetical protein
MSTSAWSFPRVAAALGRHRSRLPRYVLMELAG